MEEETQDIVVNVDVSGIVSELQNVQTQNATLISEVQTLNADVSVMREDMVLLVCFVVVLVVYTVRNVFLSFVKKGGLKNDV